VTTDNNGVLTLDPSTTALLLVHWQNEIAAFEGRNAQDMAQRVRAQGILQRTQAVLDATRKRGMLVVYINGVHAPGYPELGAKTVPLAAMLIARGSMQKGTWGVEVIDELKPMAGEILIDNYSPSGFSSTPLDVVLRARGITNLVISGIATHVAVESTTREAFNLGYTVFTLEDCCTSTTQEIHDWSIRNTLSFFGFVTDAAGYIAAIGSAADGKEA
jgi:nicotinamidase-related amidase